MTTNTLDELFWKDEKFFNSLGDEVKAKIIGKPIIIGDWNKIRKIPNHEVILLELSKLIEKNKIYEKANSYIKGSKENCPSSIHGDPIYLIPVQFYEI